MITLQWTIKRMALIAVATAMWADVTSAAGAFAEARPSDIAAKGYSFGSAFNFKTQEEASAAALARCRDSKSEERRNLCKVVVVFWGQCIAVAMDPKDGTPGVGWAVAGTQKQAERQALGQCGETAGADRRAFCVVNKGAGCDAK